MARLSKAFKDEFSLKLAGARMLAGYRFAREFAEAIGEAEGTYTRWERGETTPSIEQLVTICQVCGLTPNDLLLSKVRNEKSLIEDKPQKRALTKPHEID